jgi:dihydrodipicolinate synthase/N-acetylneuraminate lyase
MDIEEAKHSLTGPVMSLRTPFDQEGEIDFEAARKIIDCGIDGGTRTIMLTVGDSHYDCLSDDEITELTRVTVEHSAGRAMVIAADRYHSTKRAVAFAKHCKELGADMFMPLPPDWGGSCTPESMSEHYAAIAEAMPVMIVTNRFIPRGVPFGLETLERSFDLSPNILAIKDDMCGTFAHDICMRFSDRVAIVAGGQKRNHMNMYPYGCTGYLSTFAMYNPSFAQSYWKAIESKDLVEATRLIEEKDAPFFNTIIKVKGGFDAAMHGMIELYGLGQRYRRKPYHTITDGDLADLKEFLVGLDLL